VTMPPSHPYPQQPMPAPLPRKLPPTWVPRPLRPATAWLQNLPTPARIVTSLALGLLSFCIVCSCCGGIATVIGGGGASTTATTASTPAPTNTSASTTATATPHGVPVLTFTGGDTLDSGPKRSATFSIGTDASWQVHYTCTTAADFDSGFFIFVVHNGNGTGADMSGPLGPTTCPKGTTDGTVTVPETPNGNPQSRYLEVTAHGVTWTLTVIA
jgi:hypothetical protein